MDGDEYKFYRTVGELIQANRKELHLSQLDLGKVIGLSRVSISYVESGKQRCELWDLVRIAQKMSIDPSELLPPEWQKK